MEPNEENKNKLDTNEITIVGQVETLDGIFENHGKKFQKILVRVVRLSGQDDYIPVVYLAERITLNLLDRIKITGSVRTRNNTSNGKSKLELYVYADWLDLTDEEDTNDFNITGYICKPVQYRETPKGVKISDIMLAYNGTFNHSYYMPALTFNKVALAARDLKVGDKISINGRFQSRDYTKVIDNVSYQRTAYELAIKSFVKSI